MIRSRRAPLPVLDCCRLLRVSRASMYRRPTRDESAADEALVELAGLHPRFGYRRLAVMAGTSPKTMRTRMKRLGLMVRRKPSRKRTTFPVPVDAPNLCQAVTAPGQLLASDFTYIPLTQGFAYLAITLDVFTRRVRGFRVSRTMRSDFVVQALDMALARGPVSPNWIHHSDRGSQYACETFRKRVAEFGGLSSFSSPASPGENAFAESFFSRFKDEVVNLREPLNYEQTAREINNYIEFYNASRPHSSIGDISPMTYEMRIAENALIECVS